MKFSGQKVYNLWPLPHLSPLLFVIVTEAICREFRVALPWELLYADDFVVIAESEEDLINRLNE